MPGEPSTSTTQVNHTRSRSRKRGTSSHANESKPKRARTRDSTQTPMSAVSIRKRRSKRSLKGKEKATSDGDEEIQGQEGSSVEDKEVEELVASPSASTSTGTSQSSPGHTSVTSLDSNDPTLPRLQKELALKDEIIEKQNATFASLQNILQCQICLELMWRPYSLTPCGHVACESCLIAWFSQPSQHEVDIEMPLLMPELRKKTCPTCRTEVRSRPVVAYLVKSALHTILPCLDPSSYDKEEVEGSGSRLDDPWNGIFPSDDSQRRRDDHANVIIDDEDGVARCPRCLHEIFDQVCTGCGHLYDDLSDEDADDMDDEILGNPYGLGIAMGMPGWPYGDNSDAEEDGHSEDDGPYESDFIDDDGGAVHNYYDDDDEQPPHYVPNPNRLPRQNRRGRPHALDIHYDLDDDDDPVEHGGPAGGPSASRRQVETIEIVDSDGNESDWASRPRHERLAAESRRAGANNRRPIVISSDEGSSGSDSDEYDSASGARAFFSADEDDEQPMSAVTARPPHQTSSRQHIPVSSDSEDDKEGVEDDTSDAEMYEDAASSTEKTSTSIDRHSPQHDLSDDDNVHHHEDPWHSDDSEEHDELSSPPLGPYTGSMNISDEEENSEMDGYSSGGSLD